MGRFVVIYHPGGHTKHRKPLSWTTDNHKRKFMQMPGYATNAPNVRPTKKNELYFWGEYEPDTTGTPLTVPSGAIPNAYPYRVDVPDPIVPQQQQGVLNTDPFVFCGPLIYSNCQQTLGEPPKVRVRGTQTLQQHDVILFGSQHNGNFVLDTCLVIDTVTPLHQYRHGCRMFDDITGTILRALAKRKYGPFTIFEGKGWQSDKPFSFIPAWDSLAKGNSGHQRPTITPRGALKDAISPGQPTGMNGIIRPLASTQIVDMWNEVVRQVLHQKCMLGTEIIHPYCTNCNTATRHAPLTAGTGCGSAPSPVTKGGNPAPDVIGGSC